jgi:hypothetical protein
MSEGVSLCVTRAERAAFAAWRGRLEDLALELGPADEYVVAVIAVREVRLRELTRAVARARKQTEKLRAIAAERMASADFAKALDMAERLFGARVGEEIQEEALGATGTAGTRVVPFIPAGRMKARTVAGQRIVAVLGRGVALTKAELRRRVPGAQGAFLAGLKEAVASGAVKREGEGTKARPFRYRRSEG